MWGSMCGSFECTHGCRDRRTGRFHSHISAFCLLALGRRRSPELRWSDDVELLVRILVFIGVALPSSYPECSFSAEWTGIFSTGNEDSHLFHKQAP